MLVDLSRVSVSIFTRLHFKATCIVSQREEFFFGSEFTAKQTCVQITECLLGPKGRKKTVSKCSTAIKAYSFSFCFFFLFLFYTLYFVVPHTLTLCCTTIQVHEVLNDLACTFFSFFSKGINIGLCCKSLLEMSPLWDWFLQEFQSLLWVCEIILISLYWLIFLVCSSLGCHSNLHARQNHFL